MFTNTAGSKINLSNFHRDIWGAARTATFPADSPLRQARRHDLRHAAITAWLNAGVPLKTCQAWSGHATVSVLLDTYLGATRGDDQLGQQRVDAALNDLLDHDDPTTTTRIAETDSAVRRYEPAFTPCRTSSDRVGDHAPRDDTPLPA